jgi:hypothetical protein
VDVAIVMPTIRRQACRVAELFIDDLAASEVKYGKINIYFSVDHPLRPEDISITNRDNVTACVIDSSARIRLAESLSISCTEPQLLGVALTRSGVAAQRNAGLVYAAAQGNNYIINLDDDVFPHVPVARGLHEHEWLSGGAIADHIRQLQYGAEVTSGAYTGYVSPLMQLPSEILAPAKADAIGAAISLGNELIDSRCLSIPNIPRVIGRLDESGAESQSRPVIFGGNLALSAEALLNGHIPPFFSPRGARGDDTFFALNIEESVITSMISSKVFHDPFGMCRELIDGTYPARLTGQPEYCIENVKRMTSAITGWLSYAPLWLLCKHEAATRCFRVRRLTCQDDIRAGQH